MNYETGFQLGVMEARLKDMRKQRDEYKKQRDELIGDIAKLRERNKELEKKSEAWNELRETYLKNYKNHINQDDRNRSMLIEQQYLSFLFAMDCIEGSNHLQEFLDQLEGEA
ncbi:phage protein [Staphylococcus aureus]|nr:phage protein [Staphylococcus aureus]CAC5917676.1 phage protein [Staphylococcus aureus]